MSSTSNIYLGNLNMEGAYFGGLEVEAIYLGENEVYSSGPFVGLRLSPNTKQIPYTGSTFELKVKSSEDWTLSMDSTYLSADAYSGTSGESIVTITAAANTGDTDIVTTITALTANYSAETNVTIKHHIQDYSKLHLTFEILSSGNIRFASIDTSNIRTIEYSKDGGANWVSVTSSIGSGGAPWTGGTMIAVNQGDIVMFRGSNNSYGGSSYYNGFEGTDVSFNVYGNITSMIYGSSFTGQTSFNGGDNNFRNFFSNCSGLTSMENLVFPTDVLVSSYSWFAQSCSSLIKAPKELPATYLNSSCYQSMFRYTSITDSPRLPQITRIASNSFQQMFKGCSSLSGITCLCTTAPSTLRFTDWVDGVASAGTFVKKAGVTWTTGTSGIPSGWTVIEE